MHRLFMALFLGLAWTFTPVVQSGEPVPQALQALRSSEVALATSWTRCGQTWVTTLVLTGLQRFGLTRGEPPLFAVYQVAEPLTPQIRRIAGAAQTEALYEVRWYAQQYRSWYTLIGSWTPWNANRGNGIYFFRSLVQVGTTGVTVSSEQVLHGPGAFKKPACQAIPQG